MQARSSGCQLWRSIKATAIACAYWLGRRSPGARPSNSSKWSSTYSSSRTASTRDETIGAPWSRKPPRGQVGVECRGASAWRCCAWRRRLASASPGAVHEVSAPKDHAVRILARAAFDARAWALLMLGEGWRCPFRFTASAITSTPIPLGIAALPAWRRGPRIRIRVGDTRKRNRKGQLVLTTTRDDRPVTI